jgi:ubiquilin
MPTPEQMAQMQAMFGGGGSPFGGFGGAASRPAADTRPAHERFANQLEQLQGMGFYDGQANIEALTVCGGNVSAAVEYLFSHPPSGGN